MKVRELKEYLNQYDNDMKVYIDFDDMDKCCTITLNIQEVLKTKKKDYVSLYCNYDDIIDTTKWKRI